MLPSSLRGVLSGSWRLASARCALQRGGQDRLAGAALQNARAVGSANVPLAVHDGPSGAERGALLRIWEEKQARNLKDSPVRTIAPPEGAVVVRKHNQPRRSAGTNFPVQAYPSHPHNFTPLRPVPAGFSAVDRAIRDVAVESRFDILDRGIAPKYADEVIGTPRREIQDGLVAGVRVRPVQNPYVRLNREKRYVLNSWPSRDWSKWNPRRTEVRGSRRSYRLPEDITPYRDELGEWHPPRVSGRYKADIEKQYYMNSLPWVWANDYYDGKQHFMDREPKGQRRWYKREYRKAQIAEALKRVDSLVEEYRKERRQAKRLSWVENVVLEFAGSQLGGPYVRTRKVPKM